jgi:hypothetical protein
MFNGKFSRNFSHAFRFPRIQGANKNLKQIHRGESNNVSQCHNFSMESRQCRARESENIEAAPVVLPPPPQQQQQQQHASFVK